MQCTGPSLGYAYRAAPENGAGRIQPKVPPDSGCYLVSDMPPLADRLAADNSTKLN